MTQQRRRIDQVMDESFSKDLDNLAIDDLRSRRSICDELDTELSYYRRMIQGRIDLLDFELRRRSGEETRSLIEALPEILTDSASGRTSNPLDRELSLDLPELAGGGAREVDTALSDGFLAHLPTIEVDELRRIRDSLSEMEAKISEQRRAVYDAHDIITGEITKRYREGTASADELLSTS
ncbi:MAG: hypothetical protein QGM46_09465 [Actinomycetota bacterium]|nr:hypothetical protein [Actinomycetota bacterium]MDK1039288.1 hypothetical protein [Actinomycetota bacterium]MDK1292548.1 hypothetical protein [Actinomycetota bacterium]